MKRYCIDRVWTDDTCLWIETKDGRKVCTPFSKWKRLENATKAQRDDFILGYTGIHWPSLDEESSAASSTGKVFTSSGRMITIGSAARMP